MEQQQIFIQMVLKAWNIQVSRADKFFEALTDESLMKEVAPARNRIIYVLGHLIAVNDTMVSLFGSGERLYAHLDEPFVKNPDNTATNFPDPSVLKNDWKKLNGILSSQFALMSSADWFGKHAAMTEEDIIKEPTRNKLSVLINRTNHLAYHLGQLVLVN